MSVLKQSTAYKRMFLLVQSSDHISGLTGATVTATISKAGASFGSPGGSITEVGNGWYYINYNTTDTGTLGDLACHCTAISADPTDFVDQVTANILGDTLPVNVASINSVSTSSVTTINANIGATQALTFDGNNFLKVDLVDIAGAAVSTSSAQLGVNVVAVAGAASNIKKNQQLSNFMFVMTDSTNHAPVTGKTVSATRSLDGGSFASCANSVTEVANGWYMITLATTDTNCNVLALRFTASSSDDRDITLITQP